MIQIEIRYFATLRVEGKKKEVVETKENSTAAQVLAILSLKEEDIAILLINGVISKTDATLKNMDVLSLFPPVGGG